MAKLVGLMRVVTFVGICVATFGVAVGVGVGQVSAKESNGGGPSGAAADPCVLVTKAEAEKLFGEPLREPSAERGSCLYQRASGMPLVGVEFYPKMTKSSFQDQVTFAAKSMNAKVKPVPGYGELAFSVGEMVLAVFKNGKSINVSHVMPKTPTPAQLEAFTRQALSRL